MPSAPLSLLRAFRMAPLCHEAGTREFCQPVLGIRPVYARPCLSICCTRLICYVRAGEGTPGSTEEIVQLLSSFQDRDILSSVTRSVHITTHRFHFDLISGQVLEFMGGGDLLNLLIERDVFEEDFTRFYVAEVRLYLCSPVDGVCPLTPFCPNFAPSSPPSHD